MSFKSRKKIHPISEDGIASIESEIKLHERKMKKAKELKQMKIASSHKERIAQLQEKLRRRKAVTASTESEITLANIHKKTIHLLKKMGKGIH